MQPTDEKVQAYNSAKEPPVNTQNRPYMIT